MGTDWSDDMIQDLRCWHNTSDLSAAGIANALNQKYGTDLKRNAVIGKLHRLSGYKAPNPRQRAEAAKAVPSNLFTKLKPRERVQLIKKVPVVNEATNVIEITQTFPYKDRQGCGLNDLTIYTCHWPLGSIKEHPPYRYCGKPTITVVKKTATSFDSCQSPWCVEHHAQARRSA